MKKLFITSIVLLALGFPQGLFASSGSGDDYILEMMEGRLPKCPGAYTVSGTGGNKTLSSCLNSKLSRELINSFANDSCLIVLRNKDRYHEGLYCDASANGCFNCQVKSGWTNTEDLYLFTVCGRENFYTSSTGKFTMQDIASAAHNKTCDFDLDGDYWINDKDNCPLVANYAQEAVECSPDSPPAPADNPEPPQDNNDNDTDVDNDNVSDANDNCPNAPNADQADADADSIGDACDACINIFDPTNESAACLNAAIILSATNTKKAGNSCSLISNSVSGMGRLLVLLPLMIPFILINIRRR